jgi:hypothetical protein
MDLFILTYDMDEAVYLVKGSSHNEAWDNWLEDREAAGATGLRRSLADVRAVNFKGKSKVAMINENLEEMLQRSPR